MGREERKRSKARKKLDKAELLYDNERYDKASSLFDKAADGYRELGEYKIAEQCYYYAARSYLHEQDFLDGSDAMRNAANCCIFLEDYKKCAEYYDVSAKYALKSNKYKEAEFKSILSASFAYLCWFIQGQQDKGLAFIKRIKRNVDSSEFAENRLTKLVKGLTLAIINKDDSALRIVEDEFINYKFRESEMKLIKDALILAKTHLLLKYWVEIENTEVTHEELLNYSLNIDFSDIKKIESDEYLAHKFKSLRIVDVGITQSDNLSTKKVPKTPIAIDKIKMKLDFSARANFPGEGYVGPLMFTIELDGKLYFFAKTKKHDIQVKSPPAQLGINLQPLKNPMINQTFPMEVVVNNPSDADVSNITIEFEFPKSLRLMRGTQEKKIYQLIKNEDFTWNLSLKPLEPGTHTIKATLTFFDQDGKKIGPKSAELPFEINL